MGLDTPSSVGRELWDLHSAGLSNLSKEEAADEGRAHTESWWPMPLKDVLISVLASFPERAGKMRLAARKMAADVTQMDSIVCTTPCKRLTGI